MAGMRHAYVIGYERTRLDMKYLILLLISTNALAVTPEECTSKGKNYVKAVVTINGDYRKAHCRKSSVRSELTKAEKLEKLNALKSSHPEMSAQIEAKIKAVANE